MDVELQILKHLARDAQPTVSFIDKYCVGYKDLFPEVRSYECFKYLHLGIISGIKRKSLPEIAKVVGLKSAQALHHFIAKSPWSVTELRERRLSQTLAALKGNTITVVIDETGDRKKGKTTKELIEFGFKIDLVLADSLYGKTSLFIRTLDEYKLPWIVAIRSNPRISDSKNFGISFTISKTS
jgi:SRSO17 transposase